jgi:polyferredoxin
MRTLLYAAVIAVVGGVMLYTLATRELEGISVIHDRNPMFVRLSEGALRNGYTIRIVNKQRTTREFILSLDGLPAGLIDFVGVPPRADGQLLLDVGPDQTREVRILVTDYGAPPPASSRVVFRLTDVATGEQSETRDHFFAPEN